MVEDLVFETLRGGNDYSIRFLFGLCCVGWCAVEWLVVVEDACEVGHARFTFPDGVAVDAGGSVLVEGEAAFADVFAAFVSPYVGFVAFGAWCAEFH